MDGSRARWSDLLPELWTAIGKYIDTYIDVLRCRSVCRSWRASLPPLNAVSPLLHLHVPSPVADHPIGALLIREITYRLSPLHQTSDSVVEEGWFAMVKTKNDGKMRFLRPLHQSYLRLQYDALRKEVNLLDFRIQEVSKSYSLESFDGIRLFGINKVIMFPDSPWIDAEDCTLVAIYKDGKLGFVKLRDHKWTLIEGQHNNLHCDDVITWRGEFYAVDKSGIVFKIDSESGEIETNFSATVWFWRPQVSGEGRRRRALCGGSIQTKSTRSVPERVYPFSKGVCHNLYEFCCDRSNVYNLEPLPSAQVLEERSRPYTCSDMVRCRCCC